MAVLMAAWFFYATLWVLKSAILVHSEGEPRFRGTPKTNYSAYLGGSVKLKCPATGTNGPNTKKTFVIWYKGNEMIQSGDEKYKSRFMMDRPKRLKITGIKKEDAGIYKCNAYNMHGKIELVIVLNVKSVKKPGRGKPPRFKEKLKIKKNYKTGETAKLPCHSTGDPDPNVKWFKDGVPYGVNRRTSVAADGWTLNLRYLKTDDTGLYSCRVSNNVGYIIRNFTVIVKERSMKPVIEEPEEKMRAVSRGLSVKFFCKVSSVGEVTFDWRWSRENGNKTVDLKPLKEFGSKYIGNASCHYETSLNLFYYDGFLVIKNVEEKDEGRYSCLVKNNHGKDKMDFFLRVKKSAETDEDQNENRFFLPATQKPPHGTSSQEGERVDSEEGISITLVAILTATIVVAMIFIVVLVMCCRKQRKNLEKQYVDEYQPQSLFQPYPEHTSIYQEMQRYAQKNHSGIAVDANAGSENPHIYEQVSFPSSLNSCKTNGESTTAQSVSSEMYLANSRTSLQTTLCQGCPRETSLDCKGKKRTFATSKDWTITGVNFTVGSHPPG
ncbi:fibroblast growth factor receptor-like 1 [Dendronephthya gigantea]|uniref:fibroblast growth factor receptor-like 1 n=1 Tax=Dendronephthya gigantea TaxID=151771 RepID=UPI00106CD96E|nr:fibroblast growth factor receptor-like 1 [Dendronephthya gigantea]